MKLPKTIEEVNKFMGMDVAPFTSPFFTYTAQDILNSFLEYKRKNQYKSKPKWIEWHGGQCPVVGSTIVKVKCRGGKNWYGKAEDCRWSHNNSMFYHGDVIAYRIIEGK